MPPISLNRDHKLHCALQTEAVLEVVTNKWWL